MMQTLRHDDPAHAALRTAAWILLIAASSVGFSLAFACATPFVALAAVAGTQMKLRDALAAVFVAWLGNQAIGFLVLHYPQTWDCYGWGAAIAIAALLATLLAAAAAATIRPIVPMLALAFLAAFATDEGVLLAGTLALPSGAAFALHIVLHILAINAVAYVGLLVMHRLAMRVGLLPPRSAPIPA